MDSDELSRGNFEVGFRPQQSVKAGRERQPEAQLQGGGPAGGGEAESRPPQPPERGLAVSPAPPGALSCSPGWCSAFYEADCFGPDVHSYVQELAGQKASGDPAANAQSPVSPASAGGEGARPRPALLSAWRWRGSARACPSLEDGARPGACLGLSGGRVLGPALISAWWRVGGTGLSPAPVSAWGRGQGSAPRAAGKEDALRARRTRYGQGGRVQARAPSSHLFPLPPCWAGPPLCVLQGGLCSCACIHHLGGRKQLLSFGLLATRGRLAGGHLALGTTAGFGQQGQHDR